MTIPKRSRKGLQSIMTHADRSIRTIRPHRAYMRVSAIELEKARRHTERASLVQRLLDIDQRCRDLEIEKNQLLRLLGERHAVPNTPSSRPEKDVKRTHNKKRSDRNLPKGSLSTGAGAINGHRVNGSGAAQTSRPGGSMITRMLKGRKPEPLRPLPERGARGLRIKY